MRAGPGVCSMRGWSARGRVIRCRPAFGCEASIDDMQCWWSAELVAAATEIFREDLDEGYVTVLVEMIAGAASSPALGEQVAARIAPWRAFAHRAIEATISDSPLASILPVGDAAYGVVALYLGLEMLSHLDGDGAPALALFDQASRLVALFAGASGSSSEPKDTP